MDEILIALITACVPAIASVIAVVTSNNKNNALQDERIQSIKEEMKTLTAKVEQHNNFGLKIENLSARVKTLEERK